MQHVELIRVRSKKLAKIMHTHMERAGIGYMVRQLPTSEAEPKCKVFHYISIRLHVQLKWDKAPPFS